MRYGLESSLEKWTYHPINLDLEGIRLPRKKRAKLRRMLQDFYERGPSYSCLHLYISKERGAYKGFLEVSSLKRNFYAQKTGQNIFEIVRSLISEIDLEISEWKQTRFISEGHPQAVMAKYA